VGGPRPQCPHAENVGGLLQGDDMKAASAVFAALGIIVLNVGLLGPVHAQGRAAVATDEQLIRQLSESDLKALYLWCSRAVLEGRLSGTHIPLCSVGYDTLLTRTFGNDFGALLAWSKGQTDGDRKVASVNDGTPAERP
jgi:hypothetical protein